MSTKVGGVPEILPEDMMILAEPSVSDVIEKVQIAIERHKKGEKKDDVTNATIASHTALL